MFKPNEYSADRKRTRQRIRFRSDSELGRELRRQVAAYFHTHGLARQGSAHSYLKTAMMGLWAVLPYVAFLAVGGTWWLVLFLGGMTGLACAGLAFNVQHDGGHGSYSASPRLNLLASMVLDALGMSSYLWRWKHNVLHHTYPNIGGLDSDTDVTPVARFLPSQERRWFHKYQHLYIWLLYPMLSIKWVWYDDFRTLLTGRIGGHAFPRPAGLDLALFVGGKIFFVAWAFVIPLHLQPISMVVLFYLAVQLTGGFVSAVTFQLAHCVEETATRGLPSSGDPQCVDRVRHQFEATMDFNPSSRLLAWYLGGLNLQVVHHLFPRISHEHYPALTRIISSVGEEYGVKYNVMATMSGAVRSHFRWLRRLGREGANAESNLVGQRAKQPEGSVIGGSKGSFS